MQRSRKTGSPTTSQSRDFCITSPYASSTGSRRRAERKPSLPATIRRSDTRSSAHPSLTAIDVLNECENLAELPGRKAEAASNIASTSKRGTRNAVPAPSTSKMATRSSTVTHGSASGGGACRTDGSTQPPLQ